MKNIEDVTLDDVGKDVFIMVYGGIKSIYTSYERRIIAMIKAPRGRMVLLEGSEPAIQAEAIKLFMQEHIEDK